MLGWLVVERLRDGTPTTLGAASGAVAGLVAITPCAGVRQPARLDRDRRSSPAPSAASPSSLKFRFGYDDSLDVVGVHLVGGILGSLLLGLFADATVNPAGADGLFYGGGFEPARLAGDRGRAGARVLVRRDVRDLPGARPVIGDCVSTEEEEDEGLDLALHAESAYDFGPAVGTRSGADVVDGPDRPRTEVHA